MFTMKKKNAMKIGGMIASRSRGTAAKRAAGDREDVVDERPPAGRARPVRAVRGVMSKVTSVAGHDRSSRVVPAFELASSVEVVAGELEEHVVERGGAQGEVAHPDRRVVQRDRDRADRRRAVLDADGELVVVALDADDAVHPFERGACRGGVALDPGDDRRRCRSLRFSSSGVPSATSRPRSTMPTRSASSSASSRYCVVRKMVMPSSSLRRRTSSHTLARLIGSSPVVGSSRNSTSGLCTSAAARSSRRRMPPE